MNKGFATLLLGTVIVGTFFSISGTLTYLSSSFLRFADAFGDEEINCLYSALYIPNASYDSAKEQLFIKIENVGKEKLNGLVLDIIIGENTYTETINEEIEVKQILEILVDAPNMPDDVTIKSSTCQSTSYNYQLGEDI